MLKMPIYYRKRDIEKYYKKVQKTLNCVSNDKGWNKSH